MEIIKILFKNNPQSPNMGDYIINPYNGIEQVHYTGVYVNRRYYHGNVKVIPKEFLEDTISDENLEILQSKFDSLDDGTKTRLNDQFVFIKTHRKISDDLFQLHKKIKNVEFIPKTIGHLECLFSAFYGRAPKIV